MNEDSGVTVALTLDEALVLFEFLQRYSETDSLRIDDPAEQRALWNLACLLEKTLVAPFDQDCARQLADARDRLRDEPV